MTRPRNNTHGFTAVEAVVVIVVLAIVVSVTMWQVDKRRQAMLREESAANLRRLYAALSWSWPPLSIFPGQLTPDPSSPHVEEVLLRSENRLAFISPAHPEAERMRREALANPPAAISDTSYWYIGYVIPKEGVELVFVDAYEKILRKTGKPPKEHIILQSQIELVGPDYTREIYALAPLNKPVVDGKYYGYETPLPIPILIERPGLQHGGSNVLFLDGHVEFMEYPGKWPMTERFIKALESLDELKESNADTPKK